LGGRDDMLLDVKFERWQACVVRYSCSGSGNLVVTSRIDRVVIRDKMAGGAMTSELGLEATDFEARAISPLRELGAYEALWDDPAASFKTISEKFAARPGAVPSDFVPARRAEECAGFVRERFREAHIDRYGVRVHGAGEYPEKLRAAVYPVELIYDQGWWDLVNSRSVAVVGTREPTSEGLKRTRQLR
jgi:DNA processing protein